MTFDCRARVGALMRLSHSCVVVVFLVSTAGGMEAADRAPSRQSERCAPIDAREANASDQRPAFAGQTRACAIKSSVAFDVIVLARGLERPWAVEPLPGGDLLVTEKPGRLRIVSAKGEISQPIGGVPAVDARGQGGLLDIALSPTFESDRTIYLSYAEPREGGNGTAVARAVLSPDRRTLDDVRVIFRAEPTYDGRLHYGSRLAFGPDRMLYVTMGERSDSSMRKYAQQVDSHLGKILRINPDGSAPKDNPFAGKADALPEVWTLGHRNVQSAAFDSARTIVGRGARGEGRRRAEPDRERQELRMASRHVRRRILGPGDRGCGDCAQRL